MCRISFRFHFDFRFQLRFYYSPHPHMLSVTPTFPKLLEGTQIRTSIYLQRRFIHSRLSLRFQISIALLRLRPLTCDLLQTAAVISISEFDFRFQTLAGRETEIETSISGFRFQTLAGREIEIETSISGFRFQTLAGRETETETSISISGFDFRRVS